MATVKKNAPKALTTDQRELIIRLVGPLEELGLSRSAFRDVLVEANITIDPIIDEALKVAKPSVNAAAKKVSEPTPAQESVPAAPKAKATAKKAASKKAAIPAAKAAAKKAAAPTPSPVSPKEKATAKAADPAKKSTKTAATKK